MNDGLRNRVGRKIRGGVIGMIGFLLSPLSWWNDLFINVPLAFAFAWAVSFFYRPAFEVSLVVGYWLTNVVGLVLMHHGAREMLVEKPGSFSRRELAKDVIVSLIYTLVIVILLKLGILAPWPKLAGMSGQTPH